MKYATMLRWIIAGLGLGLVAGSAAFGQGTFSGWQIAGGWPTGQMSAGADWSSDLGVDWSFGASAEGEVVVWSGQGTHWSSQPYSTVITGTTVGWELDRRGGAVGETYSGGTVTASPLINLTGGTVASQAFHLWSVLGDNSAGYGIGTDARHEGYGYYAAGDQPYAPLYWKLEWVSATQGNAITDAWLYYSGVFNQHIGGTSGSVSGVFGSDSYAWWSNGTLLLPDIKFTSSAGDYAGDPREGRIDTWVVLSVSRDPITISVIPEPSTWALLGGGAILLAVVARRRTRQPRVGATYR